MRTTVITNRITHIMNILTDERQSAYKSKKSTIGAIYNINRNLIKNNAMGKYCSTYQKLPIDLAGWNFGTSYTKRTTHQSYKNK